MLKKLWENKALAGAVGAALVAIGLYLTGDTSGAIAALSAVLAALGAHFHIQDLFVEDKKPDEPAKP